MQIHKSFSPKTIGDAIVPLLLALQAILFPVLI
jgi:hypothetical protein